RRAIVSPLLVAQGFSVLVAQEFSVAVAQGFSPAHIVDRWPDAGCFRDAIRNREHDRAKAEPAQQRHGYGPHARPRVIEGESDNARARADAIDHEPSDLVARDASISVLGQVLQPGLQPSLGDIVKVKNRQSGFARTSEEKGRVAA